MRQFFCILFYVILQSALAVFAPPPTSGPATRSMKLHVIDEQTKQPISYAAVTLDQVNPEPIRTDDNGSCTLMLTPRFGIEIVRVKCPDRPPVELIWNWNETRWEAFERPVAKNKTANDLPEEFEVALPSGHELEGRVIDEQGMPIAGAVAAVFFSNDRIGDSDWPVKKFARDNFGFTTDAAGVWHTDAAFTTLADAHVVIHHNDYVEASEAGDRAEQITLHRGIRIDGAVHDSQGNPISGAYINQIESRPWHPWNFSVAERTDDDGKYRLPALAAARYEFVVSADGFAPKKTSIDVKPGATLDVVLAAAHIVRGKVLDQAGKPIERAYILPITDLMRHGGETDAEGNFSIDNAPADAIEFEITATNYQRVRHVIKPDSDNVITLSPDPQPSTQPSK